MMNGKKPRSSPSEIYDPINHVLGCEDLLNNILLFLPARTLIRFKLVSKQWLSIISDPRFCIKHCHLHVHALAPTGIYFYNAFSKSSEIDSVSISDNPDVTSIPSLSFLDHKASLLGCGFRVVQSCNGLLLCCFHTNPFSPNSTSTSSRLYCVCNPTTRAFTMLPEFPNSSENNLVLAFNPSESLNYKVVGIGAGRKLEFFIYLADQIFENEVEAKLKRGWRKVENQIEKTRICHGVFHNDDQMNPIITWFCENSIIYFDVRLEKVVAVTEQLYLPSYTFDTAYLGGCTGNGFPWTLVITHNSPHYRGGWLLFFRMGINQSPYRWRRCISRVDINHKLTSSHPEIERSRYHKQFNLQVLGVVDDAKRLFFAIPGKVICYCARSDRSWVICKLPRRQIHYPKKSGFGYSSMGYAFKFVETLSPV